MHAVVFGREWFVRHQRALVAALSVPVLGGELRAALGIGSGRIVGILPHCYTVANDDGTLTTDFRTHAKFAKRLRHEFLPIWKLAHWFDMRVANRFVPALNLGFDSLPSGPLTVYPDAGNPGRTTCNGTVGADYTSDFSMDWTFLQGDGGNTHLTGAVQNAGAFVIASTEVTDVWGTLKRSIFLFDTAALTVNAMVTAATLSLAGSGSKVDGLSALPDADIYASTPASNTVLVNADYLQVGTISLTGAAVSYASLASSGYQAFVLNADGLANISTTSISKFGCRNANYDVAIVAPPWTSQVFSSWDVWLADATGRANDPKLVVTYNFVNTWALPTTQQAGRTSWGAVNSGFFPPNTN